MLRVAALLALLVLVPGARAFDATCRSAPAGDAVACEQQRAEVALRVLSDRYAHLWAKLPAARRGAFATAERHWLNGGRWDDHAACVASNASGATAEVVAARCLADITVAHVEMLNDATGVLVAAPLR